MTMTSTHDLWQAIPLGTRTSLEQTRILVMLTVTFQALAAEGYVPDIYTTFMAYGWHYGRLFGEG